MTPGWARTGRLAAWIYGGAALAGGVLAAVGSSGLVSTADLAAHYASVRRVWWELYPAFQLLLVAFAALLPLGLALRARLGAGSPRPDLAAAAFLAAGVVGILWMLFQVGSAQAIARDSAGMDAAALKVLGEDASIWSGVINWLQRGFILLAGLGTYWASRCALQGGGLSRGLAWLGLLLTAFYWLGLVSLAARDLGFGLPDAVGSLLVLAGSLLAFGWALWLGYELGRAPAQPT